MSAAFRDAVPGVLVYSAILSLTAVSLTGSKKKSQIRQAGTAISVFFLCILSD